MTDNIIKSKDVNDKTEKPVKKVAAKKAPAVKKEEKIAEPENSNTVIVIFESGSSYRSNDISFTRANPIQEVSAEVASILLELDNFRIANQFEIEKYLNSEED